MHTDTNTSQGIQSDDVVTVDQSQRRADKITSPRGPIPVTKFGKAVRYSVRDISLRPQSAPSPLRPEWGD
jgi:hypothetical protein